MVINIKDFNEYNKNKGKCVAYAESGGIVYFAVSGHDGADDTTEEACGIVRSIISSKIKGRKKIKRCRIESTFTVMKHIDYPHFITTTKESVSLDLNYCKEKETKIYTDLSTNLKTTFHFEELIDKNQKVYFSKKLLLYDYERSLRNFSCVERKIIGKTKNEDLEIYVRLRPCYLCLPCIKKVTYIENNKKYIASIKVENVFEKDYLISLLGRKRI